MLESDDFFTKGGKKIPDSNKEDVFYTIMRPSVK